MSLTPGHETARIITDSYRPSRYNSSRTILKSRPYDAGGSCWKSVTSTFTTKESPLDRAARMSQRYLRKDKRGRRERLLELASRGHRSPTRVWLNCNYFGVSLRNEPQKKATYHCGGWNVF